MGKGINEYRKNAFYCTDDSRVDLFFFFFQAEDGTRDRTVTGVQTCALPIFAVPASLSASISAQGAPAPPPGVAIHHVQLSVAPQNMERTRDFYQTLVGAKVHSHRDTDRKSVV